MSAPTHSTQRMEAECCIFILFLRFRMLSEDWYTWMLMETERLEGPRQSVQLSALS